MEQKDIKGIIPALNDEKIGKTYFNFKLKAFQGVYFYFTSNILILS